MKIDRKRIKDAFQKGLWQGLGASCLIYAPSVPGKAHRSSDLESMRSDWQRIGRDFDAAIQKARKESNIRA